MGRAVDVKPNPLGEGIPGTPRYTGRVCYGLSCRGPAVCYVVSCRALPGCYIPSCRGVPGGWVVGVCQGFAKVCRAEMSGVCSCFAKDCRGGLPILCKGYAHALQRVCTAFAQPYVQSRFLDIMRGAKKSGRGGGHMRGLRHIFLVCLK